MTKKFSLENLLGVRLVDVDELRKFVSGWFKPGDLIALSRQPVRGRGLQSVVVDYDDLMCIDADSLSDLCWDKENDIHFTLYFSINPVNRNSMGDLKYGEWEFARPKKENIGEIRGMWSDLDVKDTGFEDKESAWDFALGVDVAPTMVVDNGRFGGLHCYWKVNGGVDSDAMLKWWTYLNGLAEGVNLDKLIDVTRMARLPGGIYWGDDEESDIVRVGYSSGAVLEVTELERLVEEPYRRFLDYREGLKLKRNRREKEVSREIGSTWSYMYWKTSIDMWLGENVDWANILEPFGWIMIADRGRNGRDWARPGRESRSASTDYVWEDTGVSGAMNLFSSSVETGLSDLLEIGEVLTKYRVVLRLFYNDDEKKMLEDYRKVLENA